MSNTIPPVSSENQSMFENGFLPEQYMVRRVQMKRRKKGAKNEKTCL